MRLFLILLSIVCLTAFSAFYSPAPNDVATNLRSSYFQSLSKLYNASLQFKVTLQRGSAAEIRKSFRDLRFQYKLCETFTEYFFKPMAIQLNGVPLPQADDLDPEVEMPPPSGMQMIESFIYPEVTKDSKKQALIYTGQLIESVMQLQSATEGMAFNDENITDALLEEFYRLQALGISGFDSQIAFNSLPECKAVLMNIQQIVNAYESAIEEKLPGHFATMNSLLNASITYLDLQKDFNGFDRMSFIKKYLNPLTIEVAAYKMKCGFKSNPSPIFYSALKKTGSLYDADAFDVNVFTGDFTITPSKVEFGRLLFNETAFSSNGKRACASCHLAEKGFTDGLAKSTDINTHAELPRNAPTLWNSALQRSLFHDGRGRNMEALVMEVLSNSKEMNVSAEAAVENVLKQEKYAALYKTIYPDSKTDEAVVNVCNAIACYVRTILTFNSRFDKYMRNDSAAMSPNEINGFNVFMGKGRCATCHFMPLFNGSKPPRYFFQESEVLGVPATTDTVNAVIDADLGRYNYTKLEFQKFAFKTPTLRNIEYTAPYMHNGVYKTLEEVVDFYEKGGGKGLHIAPQNQTLPFDKLKLTPAEKKNLVAFMKTLSDTTSAYRH